MSESHRSIPTWVIFLGLIVSSGVVVVLYRDRLEVWGHSVTSPAGTGNVEKPVDEHDHPHESSAEATVSQTLRLSPQARKNLGLVMLPVTLQSYWRRVLIPGEIVDRPGLSDRGVTAPAVGVVTQIAAFPGDTVRPGDRLFTLRLISEYIQNTQSELFRATREIDLIQEQQTRIKEAVESGAIPKTRLIELDQQLRRQEAAIQGYRQDLLTRGLTPAQLSEVTEGQFVSTIDVVAPASLVTGTAAPMIDTTPGAPDTAAPAYELQELKVDLGTQVQAGQLLGVLSNHHSLYVEGHAFKREAASLEMAAQNGWPVEIEFAEDTAEHWPPLEQVFEIRHLANSIDRESRTFDFFIPLTNQSRPYEKSGRTFVVWRFRPGQRVRMQVPVEELPQVIVLPATAIVREGPEAYVFRQNGELLNRRPVQVLHEDRLHVVIANDGSVVPGVNVAQSGAASLNRVLKAQAAGGAPAGVHVHADGSVHTSH